VQASKAGLLEIADVFVINKADRPAVEEARRDLEHMLDLAALDEGEWRPPIVTTVASESRGIDDLVTAIDEHRTWLTDTGALEVKRAARLREELVGIVSERVIERVKALRSGADFERLQARVAARDLDPWTAADELLARLE